MLNLPENWIFSKWSWETFRFVRMKFWFRAREFRELNISNGSFELRMIDGFSFISHNFPALCVMNHTPCLTWWINGCPRNLINNINTFSWTTTTSSVFSIRFYSSFREISINNDNNNNFNHSNSNLPHSLGVLSSTEHEL